MNDSAAILTVWLAVGGLCALGAGFIAEGRGRSFSLWLLLGLLFGPLALLLAAVMPREGQHATTPLAAPNRLDDLARLADLRDRGVLSEAEFDAEKAKLLG